MIFIFVAVFFARAVEALPGCGSLMSGFPSQSVRAGCWCQVANGTNVCFDRTAAGGALRADIGNSSHDWIEDANNVQYCNVNQLAGGYAAEQILKSLGCVVVEGFCDTANSPNTACCDLKCDAPKDSCDTYRACNAPSPTTTQTPSPTTTPSASQTTATATSTAATSDGGGPQTTTTTTIGGGSSTETSKATTSIENTPATTTTTTANIATTTSTSSTTNSVSFFALFATVVLLSN